MFVFTLLLPVETAVVAAAGLVMIEAINAERAKKQKRSLSVWVKPIFHRRVCCITTKQPSDDLLPPACRRSQEYEY